MFKDYLKLIRVSNWVKNVFVFVALIFSKHFTELNYLFASLLAFVAFSLASSIVYIINDSLDAEKDRHHPQKKNRPIASGRISIKTAGLFALFLAVGLSIILTFTNEYFTGSIFLYIIINILYSTMLKRIVILDLMCLASGFMLRVLGGAYVIDVQVSNWLILTTLFLSIFLAVMKRKSELETVTNYAETRKVLQEYSKDFVDQISAVSSAGILLSYALYSVSERTELYFNTRHLVYTTVFVIFGVFRYMYLVYQKRKGENTIEIVLKDPAMVINSILYFLSLILIIYLSA